VPNREQEGKEDLAVFHDSGDALRYRAAKRAARGDRSPTLGEGFTEPLRAEVRRTLLSHLQEQEAQRLREQDLDSLLMTLQPDLAVVKVDRTGSKPRDWLCYLHVWLPSGWKPDRAPIPRYRFVWGLQTHPGLDGHPLRAPHSRCNGEDLWLRVERQVFLPLPEHDALIFLIHPYVDPVENLTPEQGASLLAAVRGMANKGESLLEYKFGEGYENEYPAISEFLQFRFGPV
jgi:hypothetical protein